MDKSQSPHPTEPLLEAILTNQDKNAKSQESVLEAILVNQDSNAKSVEPILEASLVKQDEIVKAIKDKPEVQKIKIVTDESELADNFFRMLRGQKGETGEKGDKGDSIKGDKGDKGDKGERGEQGVAGPKGDSIKGDKGEQGKDGRDGLDGRDGVDGKDGVQGPAGKDGKSIDPKDIKKIAKELNNNNNLFLNIPGVKHVNAGSNITITGTDEEPIINATGGGGGSGTVTSVSVTTANGVSGSVATSTTTPAISITLGDITPSKVNNLLVWQGLGNNTETVAVGQFALDSVTSGVSNTAFGRSALTANTTGHQNVALGYGTLVSNVSGSNNTAVGLSSLALSTGSGNVALGFASGLYETGSNAFYVDNQDRTDTAGDKAKALLYGTFNATASSQTLKTNAAFEATYGMNIPTGQTYKINGVPISTGSGITRTITSIAAPTTAGSTASVDYVYLVSGTTTLTLPTAVGNTNRYTVKNVSGSTTIATTSAQTIDGSSTATLPVVYSSLDLVSDGSNWLVI